MTNYKEIPTYRDGQWVNDTIFAKREDFRDFLLSIFKEPGQYNFDEHSLIFNAEARKFQKQKYYCFWQLNISFLQPGLLCLGRQECCFEQI